MERIVFFGAKSYDRESFDKVNEKFGFELKYFKAHPTLDNVSLTQGATAVCVFVNDPVNADIVRAMADHGVKLIALRCAGYNNVDLQAAAEVGIRVVRVPAYSPHAIAEYALALMLAADRHIPRAVTRTRDGNFSLQGLLGFDLYGKTLGVIGTGKIAKVLVRMLSGFGMTILGYDPYPDEEFALVTLPAHSRDTLCDQCRKHCQDEGRRDDCQHRSRTAHRHQRPHRRSQVEEDWFGCPRCL